MMGMLWCTAMAGGCAKRTIQIDSDPPGALVYLNDREVGRTPTRVGFTYYGTYDVRLEKEGYQPLWTTAKAKAPWWEYPGPDLLSEAVGARSRVHWSFNLEPQQPYDETSADGLVDRAMGMREKVGEVVE